MIDLASGQRSEIVTHLHASALAVSPDRKYVVCANAGSDNLSVIDTASDAIVETIWAKPKPSELLGGHAQRPGLRPRRPHAVRGQRHAERRRRDRVRPANRGARSCSG